MTEDQYCGRIGVVGVVVKERKEQNLICKDKGLKLGGGPFADIIPSAVASRNTGQRVMVSDMSRLWRRTS